MIQYDENESEFETMSSTTTGNTFGTTSNDDWLLKKNIIKLKFSFILKEIIQNVF